MESEGARLASFGIHLLDQDQGLCSQNPYISPMKLAQAGFYRRDGLQQDAVECYSCGLCVVNWGRQSPLTVHRVLRPNCKHLRELLNTPVRPALTIPGSGPVDSTTLQSVRRRLFGETSPAGDGRASILDVVDSSVINGIVVEDTLMFYESHRLMTFANPLDTISKDWAKEGFTMQMNESDVCVVCVFCGKKASFEAGKPAEVHRKISPGCPLYCHVDVGNVTMKDEVEIKQRHGDSAGDSADDGRQHRYPNFQDQAKRLETFCKWSKLMQKILPKETMAEAGFFYTGCADCVQCFSCGMNLRNWEPDDNGIDIWQQHARVRPTCLYLLEQRDQAFVSACANIQLECEFDPPKEGPLMVQGNMRTPSCLEPGLPLDAVQAALECGYKIGLIRQALRFVFLASCGYWPNWPLLLGKLQSYEANNKLLQQKDSRMKDMAQEARQYQQEAQQKDTQHQQQLQQKDTQLQQKDTQHQQQLQQKDIQLQQKDIQCLLQLQQIQVLNQQLLQERLQRQEEEQRDAQHKLSLISRQRQELVGNRLKLASKDKELVSKDKELIKNKQELANKERKLLQKLAKLCSLLEETGAKLPDLEDSETEEAPAASPETEQLEPPQPQQLVDDDNQGQDMTPAGDLEEVDDLQSADPIDLEPAVDDLEPAGDNLDPGANDLEPADSLDPDADLAAPDDSEADDGNLPELIQCRICLQEEACAVFLPCNHLGCGPACADRLDREGRRCPFCRTPFEDWTLVYRP